MLRPILPLAGLLLASSASAATLSWEQAESAGACLSPSSVERQVEARLGRKLSDVATAQAVRVRIESRGKSWVAQIEMRDAGGGLLGRRVLTLSDDPCRQLEGFVALALALMIDPEALLFAETPATEALPPPGTEPEAPVDTPPRPAEQPLPEPPALAIVSGRGKTVVYVFPAVLPTDLARGWPRDLPTESTARLAEHLLALRLLQREVYTVVESPTFFDAQRDASRWMRDARTRPPKPESTSKGPARAPDFALIPSIEELTIQDGYDYSLGTRSRVTVVALRLRVFGVDVRGQRELTPLDVKVGFSIDGSRRDQKLRTFALQLALEKAADEMLDALRPEPAFRIRPRVVEDEEPHVELPSLRGVTAGDRFVFEAADGTRSGYASVHDVEGSRARLSVWKRGKGERVMLLSKVRRSVYSISVQGNYRLAYAAPSASERARASTSMLRARHFGAGTELGLDWKLWRESASGSRFRPLADVGWTFIAADNLALDVEIKGGLGYETPFVPALGIGLMPYVALGGFLIRGTLGADHSQNGAKLDALLGATGTFGTHLEFYRLFGDFSFLAGAELQYVLPLVSATRRDEFIDGAYPPMHALGLRFGCVWRPADYAN
jgi:hypothetical protein